MNAFKRCLALAPKHVKAEDNLGLTLQAMGRMDEALEAFRTAIAWQAEAPVKDPWPYIDMGSFLLETNQTQQAVPYLEQAIELAPDSAKAHQQLGKAYLSLREMAKAESELEAAVKLAPDNAPAITCWASCIKRWAEPRRPDRSLRGFRKSAPGTRDDENHQFHSQPQ